MEGASFCTPFLQDLEDMSNFNSLVKLLLFAIFIISVSGLMIIAGTILTNKKLQSHP